MYLLTLDNTGEHTLYITDAENDDTTPTSEDDEVWINTTNSIDQLIRDKRTRGIKSMINNNCKYARSKYNYTPSDYDLIFDYTSIPANIRMGDASNLSKRLQQCMPLSKINPFKFRNRFKKMFSSSYNAYKYAINSDDKLIEVVIK